MGEPYGKPADMWAVGCIIGELIDSQPMFPGDDELDQIYLISNSLGELTKDQKRYFSENVKFSGVQLADNARKEPLEMRYLGKI